MGDVKLDLSTSDGGIENDANFETVFDYGQYELAGKSQNMMHLDTETATQIGARLVTRYFPMDGRRHAFLVLFYYMDGDGVNSLSIIKQDQGNDQVFETQEKSGEWRRVGICITAESDPRFFIEAKCDPGVAGTVAISKIAFRICSCAECLPA